MSNLTWKMGLKDLYEFFPSADLENIEFSVALRRFHIAWLTECRSASTLVGSPFTNRADRNAKIADLWSDCEFALRFLKASCDPRSVAALVAKQLTKVLPRHRTKNSSIYDVSMFLSRFSRALRNEPELSTLVGAIAHSLNTYFFTMEGMTTTAHLPENVDEAA